jgi:hypothetical protein
MTDYRPLLARAIANLDPNTGEARRAVYDRARTALVNQLRGMNPPLAEADITRQRLSLEEAIRKVEAEAAAAPASPPRGERPPRPAAPQPRSEPAPRAAPPLRNMPSPPQDEGYSAQNDFQDDAARDPRMQRGERPDPRDRGQQPRSEPSLRPRGARGRNPADYAREDARKATRTRLVVFGLIFLLLLIAAAVGYVNRERIFSIVSGAIPLGTDMSDTTTPAPSPDKSGDRLPQQTQQQNPSTPSVQQAGSGQRAVLFEENPGTQQFTAIAGTVTWRAETISPGENRPPELMITADIDVPDRKLKVSFSIRRNPETSSSASHYVYVRFSGNDSFGGIAQVPFIRMKPNESAQGAPLVAISHKVMAGFFLLGLSAIDADRERNLTALRTQPWIDVAFVYENGRRSVIAFEKGPAGEKALADAFSAWGM